MPIMNECRIKSILFKEQTILHPDLSIRTFDIRVVDWEIGAFVCNRNAGFSTVATHVWELALGCWGCH